MRRFATLSGKNFFNAHYKVKSILDTEPGDPSIKIVVAIYVRNLHGNVTADQFGV